MANSCGFVSVEYVCVKIFITRLLHECVIFLMLQLQIAIINNLNTFVKMNISDLSLR